MNTIRTLLPLLALFGALLPAASTLAEEFQFFHENVLGTSFELRVEADSKELAEQVESTVLAEIGRLDQVLSRYKVDSELMRWQRGELTAGVSDDLAIVLTQAEQWRQRTGGAFDVRSGAFTAVWKQAEKDQKVPPQELLDGIVKQLGSKPWQQQANNIFDRSDDLQISLDGLAKGYILDSVNQLITTRFPQVRQVTVNIGGDLRKTGQESLTVSIADPANPAIGATPLAKVEVVGEVGLATSGGYHRNFEIDGHKHSHILNPCDGQPVKEVVSATVIAPTAMEADAAATSVSVLGVREGIRLIETLPGYECLIADERGIVAFSSGWPTNESRTQLSFVVFQEDEEEAAEDSVEEKKPTNGLFVDFSLPRQSGGRYRRPYVAVWLEDQDGYPVKTSVLWMMKTQPGPRWYRDLTRWYRSDRLRRIVEETNLIETTSSATRGAGEYSAHFDGTDNLGKKLPPGQYTLCLEAAREHGTYQIIRKSVQLGSDPIDIQKLEGNQEIDQVSYRYVPWSNSQPSE
ncbi:DUF2271 domain-containing protein [Thalassoglobus sp. JC818]|uniref:DUF2271 domain-containing protein n=1 Tax=Thalassoglobus sp. JC818 TaxID=3232136 RepID=UPI0034585587